MGDEAQKRNTDCVYFLASPLTCKKGADCEYRHSEAARVNPRDCRYWLSGNCLNASCSFRHPPLDGRPGVSAANHPSQVAGGASSATTITTTSTAAPSIPSTSTTLSATPTTSKSNVPCFFFSQGYCAKGVKCPFLHGPPTQYRKEATTYQRPHISEQPANGECSGVSNNPKRQIQDHKSAPQYKVPVKAALHSQEGGFISSNVYKLSASGAPTISDKCLPGNAGEKVEQAAQVGRPNLNETKRNTQLVESRILQSQISNDSSEQFTMLEKGSLKAQSLPLDSSRTIKQARQSTATYIGRSNDAPVSSGTQDPLYELEGEHGTRELHADDLRNHLKRKKNDGVDSSHLKDFRSKEFFKDRFEGSRLASRAVAVTESKDFVPINNKKARQEKESSMFSGPKSLAQIKAEKSKAATQRSLEGADSIDGRRNGEPDSDEKEVLDSASEQPCSLLPELYKELPGDESAASINMSSSKPKNIICSGVTSQHSESISNSNGLSLVLLPLTASEEAEMAANHSTGVAVAPMSKRRHIVKSETYSGGKKCHALEGTCPEMVYGPADDVTESGSGGLENVSDLDYGVDYDEEDDFAKKLGSYLS